MKKFIYGAMFLLLVGLVTACPPMLNINARYHGGYTVQQIFRYVDTRVSENCQCSTVPPEENNYYSYEYSGSSFGTGDLGMRLVGNYTFFQDWTSTYTDYLGTLFITKEEVEVLNSRMDWIEAKVNLGSGASVYNLTLESAKIKAGRFGTPQHVLNFTCYPEVCVKVI